MLSHGNFSFSLNVFVPFLHCIDPGSSLKCPRNSYFHLLVRLAILLNSTLRYAN